MLQLVLDRTYDGYLTEIQTIYGQLQTILNVTIEPAPDEWDRLFNVDFYIKMSNNYIGLQIKPVNIGLQIPEIHKEYLLQAKTHLKFKEKFGGNVFYIYSQKINNKKIIANPEIIDDIRKEIERLHNK